MYLLHKWWARKPHNIVQQYIGAYSDKGDVVLDPFGGSGVTGIEAVRAGRRGIVFDLDPLAVFIGRMSAVPVDLPLFKKYVRTVQDAVCARIEALYLTLCPKHGTNVPITHVIWADRSKCAKCGLVSLRGDRTTHENVETCPACGSKLDSGKLLGSQMLEIGYACPSCLAAAGGAKRFLLKEPTADDVSRLESLERQPIPAWIPDERLFYPDGRAFKEKQVSNTVADLFDKRALIALSLLYDAIHRLPKRGRTQGDERDLLRLCFSSNLHSVSKLNMVHGLRWRNGALPSRAWVIHSYYVPRLRIEFPVWFYFAERVDAFLAGKTESNAKIPTQEAKKLNAFLAGKGNFHTEQLDALDLDHSLPADSVDYVFTDPPYGGAIQYLELSTIYMAWLRGPDNEDFVPNYDDEVTINPQQSKDFAYYHRMLHRAFTNVFKVLKPGRYMTVTFHSTDIQVWNSILEAVGLAGFELQKIVYQPPPVKSIKAMMQPYGSAVGDYYIRFQKPKRPRPTEVTADEDHYQRVILASATKTIAHRGEPTPLTFILNDIMPALQEAGALLKGSKPITDVLRARVDDTFVLVDAVDDNGKVVGKKWWFKNPEKVRGLDRVPLDERVEKVVLDVLRSGVKIDFDDILRRVFEQFPNSLTPDTVSIDRILKEYGDKTPGGRWRLKPVVLIRESEHSIRIRELAELGKKMGYRVHVGRREQSDRADGMKLKDLNDEAVPSLTGLTTSATNRVRQIDLIWYRRGKIEAIFEVENTTGLTEALVRGSNVPYECRRYVVLPDERADLMKRKLADPAFGERFKADGWDTLFYTPVQSFYADNRHKAKVSETKFGGLAGRAAAVDASGQVKLFDL